MPSATIIGPADLQGKTIPALRALAEDIRQRILSACLKNGGHLGASLGTVEIAIALHSVFHSPEEPIIWDVGHQAYAHKLLTGRWARFDSLRTLGGLSGFLSRSESEHDVFGAGHSSTSLSAALAIAWAKGRKLRNSSLEELSWTCAVIGDGGLTAGLSFEALNNIQGQALGPLLIVLNDNQMSIAPNVGAIPAILSQGRLGELLDLFGCDYAGPLDGHDLDALVGTFRGIRENYRGRPVVVHAYTQKGRGYAPAEEFPAKYHGIGPLQGSPVGAVGKLPEPGTTFAPSRTYSDAFGEAIRAAAKKDPRIVAITAAMPDGTGLQDFAQEYPERFVDVGIAEAHATTFAAGLATQGLRPVVAVYSTFLQRAYDSIIHDVALQNLNVIFAIDRAGLVGADGPTHHGAFDMAFLGAIPNLRILAPACLDDLRVTIGEAVARGGPHAIRYPRGSGPARLNVAIIDGNRWMIRPENPSALVIAVGASTSRAAKAVESLDPEGSRIALASVLQVKPLPETLLSDLENFRDVPILTVEDGALHGGFGNALLAALHGRSAAFERAGYGDHFIPHGSPNELEDLEEVSTECLRRKLVDLLGGVSFQ